MERRSSDSNKTSDHSENEAVTHFKSLELFINGSSDLRREYIYTFS